MMNSPNERLTQLELTSVVVSARHGDQDAFAEIVRRFQGMAFALAYELLGGDIQLAEDAVQEAFLAAYINLYNLHEPVAFPGWFRRIVVKHADRFARRRTDVSLEQENDFVMATHINDPSHTFEAIESQRVLHDAIRMLPSPHRLPITLFYMHGYSQQEIADFLGLPVSTVKKRLFDARETLKEKLSMNDQLSRNGNLANRIQFFIALKSGDLPRIKYLLEHNPEFVHATTEWGEGQEGYYWPTGITIAQWAAATNNLDLLEYLASRNADLALYKGESGCSQTLLHAVQMQQAEAVAWLLNHGVKPYGIAYSQSQFSLLHEAVNTGNTEIVSILLNYGIDTNLTDSRRRTASDWAVLNNDEVMIDLLTTHGIQVTRTQQDSSGVISTKREVPIGDWMLGRILDVEGRPLEEINLPIDIEYTDISNITSSQLLTTGIKILDFTCPLVRGGFNGIFTPHRGVGKLVTIGEILTNLRLSNNGRVVSVMMEEGPYTGDNMMLCWRDMNVHTMLTQIVVKENEGLLRQQQAIESSIIIADAFRQAGHEVILLIEAGLAMVDGVIELLHTNRNMTPKSAVTVLFHGSITPETRPNIFGTLDSVITFDAERAKAGLWPAIDPIRSSTNQPLDMRHHQLLAEVKTVLQRYKDLDTKDSADSMLNEQDRLTVLRAHRINRFLTQPFHIAEAFTARKGELVSIQQTLDGLEEILRGRLDEAEEETLYFIGALT